MKILDPKALKKKIHFVPHPDQTLVLANMKRFTVLNCGRRRAILGNLTGKKVSTAWQENEAIKNLNPD